MIQVELMLAASLSSYTGTTYIAVDQLKSALIGGVVSVSRETHRYWKKRAVKII